MKGESAHRYIGNIQGFHVDPKTGEITELTDPEERDYDNILESWFGVYTVGMPPFRKVYKYHFSWTKYTFVEEKRDSQGNVTDEAHYEIIRRDEIVDSVYFRYPYPIEVKEIENKERIPVNVKTVNTIQVTNVEKLLFKTGGQWLTNVLASIQAITIEFIGGSTIDKLTEAQHETGKSGFIEKIKTINENTPGGNESIDELYGVKIITTNFAGYEIVGQMKNQLLQATNAEYLARKKAEADRIAATTANDITRETAEAQADAKIKLGNADAQVIRAKGEAEAEATKKRYEAKGNAPNSKTTTIAEAIENTKAKTLVLGNNVLPTLDVSNDDNTT